VPLPSHSHRMPSSTTTASILVRPVRHRLIRPAYAPCVCSACLQACYAVHELHVQYASYGRPLFAGAVFQEALAMHASYWHNVTLAHLVSLALAAVVSSSSVLVDHILDANGAKADLNSPGVLWNSRASGVNARSCCDEVQHGPWTS
jgi:hypothetical protein